MFWSFVQKQFSYLGTVCLRSCWWDLRGSTGAVLGRGHMGFPAVARPLMALDQCPLEQRVPVWLVRREQALSAPALREHRAQASLVLLSSPVAPG